MKRTIPEEVAMELLKQTYSPAAFVMNDPDKLSALLDSVSHSKLDLVSELIEYINEGSHPFEKVQLAVAALLYVQANSDLVPDTDSELGMVDDIAVLEVCKKMLAN